MIFTWAEDLREKTVIKTLNWRRDGYQMLNGVSYLPVAYSSALVPFIIITIILTQCSMTKINVFHVSEA